LLFFTGPSIHGEIVFTDDDAGGTRMTFSLRTVGNGTSLRHAIRLHSSYVTDDPPNATLSSRCRSAGDAVLFVDWNDVVIELPTPTPTKRTINNLTVAQISLDSVVVYAAENGTDRLGCANIVSRQVPLAEIPSADWWPSLWILLGICISCVLLERGYNSCRKVVRRRQGRSVEGFSPVPVVGFEHSKENFNDSSAAFEIEMAEDDVLTSDEEDGARRGSRGGED